MMKKNKTPIKVLRIVKKLNLTLMRTLIKSGKLGDMVPTKHWNRYR